MNQGYRYPFLRMKQAKNTGPGREVAHLSFFKNRASSMYTWNTQ